MPSRPYRAWTERSGPAGGRAACSPRVLLFLAGAARASPASEVTPDCAPRPPRHPRLILSQAECGTLGLQRGGRRESRLPLQKCAVRVSMLIFSDVSVESLFRNPFTAPGSRQPLPPGQAQRLPPPPRLAAPSLRDRTVGGWVPGRRSAITAAPSGAQGGGEGRGEEGGQAGLLITPALSSPLPLPPAALSPSVGSREESGAFLEDSTRRLDANAHKCYSQFMFLFKPMSRAADAGSSRQGLGVRGNCAHTSQGSPKLMVVCYRPSSRTNS